MHSSGRGQARLVTVAAGRVVGLEGGMAGVGSMDCGTEEGAGNWTSTMNSIV